MFIYVKRLILFMCMYAFVVSHCCMHSCAVFICYALLTTDLPRPLSNNLWIIPSEKVDWDSDIFH